MRELWKVVSGVGGKGRRGRYEAWVCSKASLLMLSPSNASFPLLLIGCFQVLAIMNNAAMNIVEHMSFWYD